MLPIYRRLFSFAPRMEDKLRSHFCSGTSYNVHIENESWYLLALGLSYPTYITLFTEVNKLRLMVSVYMLLY